MKGQATHPDSYYSHEYLEEISKLKLTEAMKKSGIGSARLQRLWQEHGIKRSAHKTGSNRHKVSTDSVTNEQLRSWAHLTNKEIAEKTNLAQETIRKLYAKRGIDRIRQKHNQERAWLEGTPVPAKCHREGCESCKHEEECRVRGENGLPLIGEGLTGDDLKVYVDMVMRRIAA